MFISIAAMGKLQKLFNDGDIIHNEWDKVSK